MANEHIDNFNKHGMERLSPSEIICVDEIFSRWYRLGGEWINLGLPQYVHIDHKTDYGCNIQDTCCRRSIVMLKLKLVKGKTED